MECPVWSLLNKSRYTSEDAVKMENIWNTFQELLDIAGIEALQELYEAWNGAPREAFSILEALVKTRGSYGR